jgi:predicted DNA-binding mobile mystery protein A
MSRAELGVRLGVTPATINDIERSEADRRVKLATLIRAADALDCDLVYALIPRQGLENTVDRAARVKLAPHLVAVARTMELEDQAAPIAPETADDEVRKLIDSGRVWS